MPMHAAADCGVSPRAHAGNEGGAPGQCGWLKDKFGLSWQIVPRALVELLQDPDPAKSGRVMQAMMQMTKLGGNTHAS